MKKTIIFTVGVIIGVWLTGTLLATYQPRPDLSRSEAIDNQTSAEIHGMVRGSNIAAEQLLEIAGQCGGQLVLRAVKGGATYGCE